MKIESNIHKMDSKAAAKALDNAETAIKEAHELHQDIATIIKDELARSDRDTQLILENIDEQIQFLEECCAESNDEEMKKEYKRQISESRKHKEEILVDARKSRESLVNDSAKIFLMLGIVVLIVGTGASIATGHVKFPEFKKLLHK